MSTARTRQGDVAIVLYLLVFALYVISFIAYLFAHPLLNVFSSLLGAYYVYTIGLTCWLYRNVLRRNGRKDSFGWLSGFLLLGGIVLPAYYFSKGVDLEPAPKARPLVSLARVLAALLALTGAISFAWAIAMALGRLHFTETYRMFGAGHRILLYVAWLTTVVLLIGQPWPPRKKIGWAIGSLVGNFLLVPVVAFAEIES